MQRENLVLVIVLCLKMFLSKYVPAVGPNFKRLSLPPTQYKLNCPVHTHQAVLLDVDFIIFHAYYIDSLSAHGSHSL